MRFHWHRKNLKHAEKPKSVPRARLCKENKNHMEIFLGKKVTIYGIFPTAHPFLLSLINRRRKTKKRRGSEQGEETFTLSHRKRNSRELYRIENCTKLNFTWLHSYIERIGKLVCATLNF